MPDIKPRYALLALAYWHAGWVPIPASDQKVPLVKGVLGNQPDPDQGKIEDWIELYGSANIALRMPKGYIALDVDAYKNDLNRLEELEEKFGKLPPTWNSDARGGTGGKLIFRLPEEYKDKKVVSNINGITVIQHTHRHIMVYPSYHKEAQSPVYWYTPHKENSTRPEHTWFPDVNDIPELNESWAQALTDRTQWSDVEIVDSPPIELDQISPKLIHHSETCDKIIKMAHDWAEWIKEEDNFHDYVKDALSSLYFAASNGHAHLDEGVKIIYDAATKLARSRDLVGEFYNILGWFNARFDAKENIIDDCDCGKSYELKLIRQDKFIDQLAIGSTIELGEDPTYQVDITKDNVSSVSWLVDKRNAFKNLSCSRRGNVVAVVSVNNGVGVRYPPCNTWRCDVCQKKKLWNAVTALAAEVGFSNSKDLYIIWGLNERTRESVLRKLNDDDPDPFLRISYENKNRVRQYAYVFVRDKTMIKKHSLMKITLLYLIKNMYQIINRIRRIRYPKFDAGVGFNYIFSFREMAGADEDVQYYRSVLLRCYNKLVKSPEGRKVWDRAKAKADNIGKSNAILGVALERMVRDELGQEESFWLKDDTPVIIRIDDANDELVREVYAAAPFSSGVDSVANRIAHGMKIEDKDRKRLAARTNDLSDTEWDIIKSLYDTHSISEKVTKAELVDIVKTSTGKNLGSAQIRKYTNKIIDMGVLSKDKEKFVLNGV